MKRPAPLFALLLILAAAAAGARPDQRWSRLDRVAQETVDAGRVPGVVFVVGHRGKIVYRKAFGSRSLTPQKTPMTADTVFDLASLTKVVATTSAVMSLIEEGRLRLSDPAARYWPEFRQNGKERVTIRNLMTHTSGLASWADFYKQFVDPAHPEQSHREQVLSAIAALPLRTPPGTRFVYSDLGFITLGEIVHRITGETLDVYVRHRIFEPLGMHDTAFDPEERLRARAAPTTIRNGHFLQGEVHDGNAAISGGVAGHAGLFSTGDDLARFAWMLLSSDFPDRHRYPLSPAAVRLMTTPQSPEGLPVRGLGWDIDSGYSHVRGDLMPLGSFGHTGFTGTYIWVDPYSDSFIIGLSNRVHPDEKGDPLRMWAMAANVVASIYPPEPVRPRERLQARPLLPAGPAPAASSASISARRCSRTTATEGIRISSRTS